MKQYNGEKAIISLTSWKARINTVDKTLFSLIQQCPGFHIVLVLSEEEFPKMTAELPENLMLFVENELIEILWIEQNYKVFMKTFFTMDKYRDVPVISADDDCVYNCNYAEKLYNTWLNNKNCIITNDMPNTKKRMGDFGPYRVSRGQNTLLTYDIMKDAINTLIWIFENDEKNKQILFNHPEDDAYNSAYYYLKNIKIIDLNLPRFYKLNSETTDNKNALHNRITYKAKESINVFVKVFESVKT